MLCVNIIKAVCGSASNKLATKRNDFVYFRPLPRAAKIGKNFAPCKREVVDGLADIKKKQSDLSSRMGRSKNIEKPFDCAYMVMLSL